jgi:hypothetical protein
MEDRPLEEPGGGLRGHAVEQAAVLWVMKYERRHGRNPVDRRHERSFAGDVDSPPRVVEIKATATSYRGWFLPLEPIQLKHAQTDPNFHLYVVENVGQGNPAAFTLRVIGGEHLRRLVSRATERHYYEVPWSTKDYDATVPELMPPEDRAGSGEIGT